MKKRVVITSALRTPIGSMGGSLSNISVSNLGSHVIKGVLEESKIDFDLVDEVFMGCVFQAGQGQNVARQAAMKAGLPCKTPATTVNLLCGSGLQTVNMAAKFISSGDADIIVAGGMENMSASPYLLTKARYGYQLGSGEVIDSMINDGLQDAFSDYHMGVTAENIAEEWNLTREELDQFAASSQLKASQAIEENKFIDEILPFEIKTKKEVTCLLRMKV